MSEYFSPDQALSLSEPLKPSVQVLKHCTATGFQHMAALMEAKAVDDGSPEALNPNQQRYVAESDLVVEMPCVLEPRGEQWSCTTMTQHPKLKYPIRSYGPTKELALRRMNRAYLDMLESRKVVRDRLQGLRISGKSVFYAPIAL